MKFEVINSNGHVVMNTDMIECVPALDELNAMSNAGYRYKVDGKIVAKSKVIEAVGGSKPIASSVYSSSKSGTHVEGVRCIETGVIYKNKVEAGKALGMSDSAVYDSIKLKKKVKGYSFEMV